MKFFLFSLFIIILLCACTNPTKRNTESKAGDRLEIPEPDKHDRLNNEAIEKLRKSGCVFLNPDTSLSGIILRDSESATKILGDPNQPDSMGQYHFCTKLERETLTLTQHPGDEKNQISVFNIMYSDKADYGYKILPIDTLTTEKGIRLGWNKKQIIEQLGSCYAALDSSNNYIELYYLLEHPNDTKTGLLGRQNMIVCYASYKLLYDQLEEFEFGFEYP